jgi:DNA-directed RNA polymerase sigma subunit (sigma70/sigma32)
MSQFSDSATEVTNMGKHSQSESTHNWLDQALRQFDFLTKRYERVIARRTGADARVDTVVARLIPAHI